MKTYLVTGGCGFIGSNFIRYMFEKYDNIQIINLDYLTYAGNLENLLDYQNNKNYKFVKGDICNQIIVSKIFKEYDIDYVVNFAAESHVDRSISEPQIFTKTNILGTSVLLYNAKENWKTDKGFKLNKKFLQVSTDEVYGSLGKEGYFTENTPLNPRNPYSACKAGADLIVKSYFDTFNFPMNITRCSNNFGPYQYPEKLIALVFNKCKNLKNIPIFGDGLQIRDWIFVEDHCKAIDLVLHKAQIGKVYNIGGHNEKTNLFIVKKIIDYVKKNVNKDCSDELITFVNDRLGHDRRYAMNSSKINKELGWKPETSFEDGLKNTLDWYKNNDEWIKKIEKKPIVKD